MTTGRPGSCAMYSRVVQLPAGIAGFLEALSLLKIVTCILHSRLARQDSMSRCTKEARLIGQLQHAKQAGLVIGDKTGATRILSCQSAWYVPVLGACQAKKRMNNSRG